VLADTSVWVEHFRRRHTGLGEYLNSGRVHCHPFVIGELACGHLARRGEILDLLHALPALEVVDHAEVLPFTTGLKLSGRGLGWIDVHLLAAARLSRVPLWTLDKRLAAAATDLGVNFAI
jgi:hypothetical protein